MRQLLLLRHAKSSWDDPQLSDHARPLNLRGRKNATMMAAAFRSLNLVPDVVLVSSARRTLQTMEALEPWERAPRIEPLDALYLAGADEILDVVRVSAPDAQCLLVVGHNPGLHDLAIRLCGADEYGGDSEMQRIALGYPSGALAQFSVTGDWGDIGPAATRLIRFLAPSDLSEVDA